MCVYKCKTPSKKGKTKVQRFMSDRTLAIFLWKLCILYHLKNALPTSCWKNMYKSFFFRIIFFSSFFRKMMNNKCWWSFYCSLLLKKNCGIVYIILFYVVSLTENKKRNFYHLKWETIESFCLLMNFYECSKNRFKYLNENYYFFGRKIACWDGNNRMLLMLMSSI